MNRTLLISFDLIRPGELGTSLAIASILAHQRSAEGLKERMHVEHLSINMLDCGGSAKVAQFETLLASRELERFDFIALSAYVWNEYLVNPFIAQLRHMGFRGKIVLGGYQITYSNHAKLLHRYRECQVFIAGHAEQAFAELPEHLTATEPIFLSVPVDFEQLASPYLIGGLSVPLGAHMVRLETKRGCPYRCSFCAHRDLTTHRVHKHPLDKVFQELAFLADRRVQRVNVLDPIFNAGNEHLEVMREIVRLGMRSTFTLQSRFENIRGEQGTAFLDLCEQANFHLEFGLQTTDPEVSRHIDRANRMDFVDAALEQLAQRGIPFEVSLIYGLPGQTLSSFRRSIDHLHGKGCAAMKAYPMMLLSGTKLYDQKAQWGMVEEPLGEFNIPVVTSSASFSRDDWESMQELAEVLDPTGRFSLPSAIGTTGDQRRDVRA
ncbi:MAG: radical SAM protein [Flavobacteriales bacterium]|nr:radical SAM protein [Flavobacteriales bacterium]